MIGVNSNMKEATLAKHKWQHSTGSSPLVAHTVPACSCGPSSDSAEFGGGFLASTQPVSQGKGPLTLMMLPHVREHVFASIVAGLVSTRIYLLVSSQHRVKIE